MNIFQKINSIQAHWIAKKTIRFDDPTTDKPDGRGESTYSASVWWNQYHNRRLLTSIMATLFSVGLFFDGFFYLIWIKYFEIKYREKKNCSRLVVQQHRFFTVPYSKRGNLHEHYA